MTNMEIKGILVTFFRDGLSGDYYQALNKAIFALQGKEPIKFPLPYELSSGDMESVMLIYRTKGKLNAVRILYKMIKHIYPKDLERGALGWSKDFIEQWEIEFPVKPENS